MALVLAVGRIFTQPRLADELARRFPGHEVMTAALTSDAFARTGSRVPDLVIFPLSLFPSEKQTLIARLHEWSPEQPISTLTADPASPSRPAAHDAQWFYWFRSHEAKQLVDSPLVHVDSVDARVAAPPQTVPAPQPVPPPPARIPEPRHTERVAPHTSASPPTITIARPAYTPDFVDRQPVTAAAEVHEAPGRRASRAVALCVAAAAAASAAARRAVALLSVLWSRICIGTARLGPLATAATRMLGRGWRVAVPVCRHTTTAIFRTVRAFVAGVRSRASEIRVPARPARAAALLVGLASLAAAGVALRSTGAVRSHVDSIASAASMDRWMAHERVVDAPAARAATTRGRLSITSDPPGAAVSMDGQGRGITPLVVDDVEEGQHTVVLEQDGGSVRQSVKVKAGQTTMLDVPIFTGWLALFAPFEVQIVDGNRVVTLDEQNRTMLPPGKHDLQLSNRTLGYRGARSIVIRPGEVTAVSVDMPKSAGTFTSNPPAEVWIDGRRAGETPLDNVPVAIGTREFAFRTATLGERRLTRTVTTKPFRVDVDFSQPER